MTDYFSDREAGPRARTAEVIGNRVWKGIKGYVQSRIADMSFGGEFPETCVEGSAICGTDSRAFRSALASHVPGIEAAFEAGEWEDVPVPETPAILDFIEFCFQRIAKPEAYEPHPYRRHDHFRFHREAGRAAFRGEINTIFARNGIAFDLQEDGTIQRLGPPVVGEWLRSAVFRTGDSELDGMLEEARRAFLDSSFDERKRGLEKVWDAYERVKTLENADKREGTRLLLDRTAEGRPVYRQKLEEEARVLTCIGNKLMIRHHETDKEPIPDGDEVDFLFSRAFSLIRLLLKKTGRGG